MMKYRVQHYIYGDAQGGSPDTIRPIGWFDNASEAQDFLKEQEPKNSWEDYELVQVLEKNYAGD